MKRLQTKFPLKKTTKTSRNDFFLFRMAIHDVLRSNQDLVDRVFESNGLNLRLKTERSISSVVGMVFESVRDNPAFSEIMDDAVKADYKQWVEAGGLQRQEETMD